MCMFAFLFAANIGVWLKTQNYDIRLPTAIAWFSDGLYLHRKYRQNVVGTSWPRQDACRRYRGYDSENHLNLFVTALLIYRVLICPANQVTNDGATILNLLEVEHPAGRVLVELAQLQVCLFRVLALPIRFEFQR